MSKLSSVLKKTGIAVAAAAMLVTMGASTPNSEEYLPAVDTQMLERRW